MRNVILCITILLFHAAMGQDSLKTMAEVTLSASKYSIKTSETGKIITIITREDLDHAGSRDLSQVITEMGGVFINGFNSTAGKEKNIYLRGAKVDYTLITIDGVPVYDASGIGSNFDIRNISIDNVERIEILKGSQSTLYGSDAIAGVINIITRKNSNKPFSIGANTYYGTYNTWHANIITSGKTRNMDYNVSYTYFTTDGFSEAQQPETSTTAFDKDGYRQHSFSTNFRIKAGKHISIQPFARYTKFDGDLDLDAFIDEKDFTNKNKNLQAGLRNVITLGNSQLNMLYQYINTTRLYVDDSIYHNPDAYFFYNRQSYKAKEHFAEAFVVLPVNRFKITVGADARISGTDYDAIQKNIYSPFIDRPGFSRDSVKQNQFSVYSLLNFSLRNLYLEGGIRLNHHSEYGENYAFNFNPSYLINQKIKIFANASTGYKVPSLYQLFSFYGNKELQPEKSVTFETGAQYSSENGKNIMRIAYFNRHIRDAIAFFYNPSTFQSTYINQDKQKDHGIEIEARSVLFGKIQAKLLYSYVTGNITTVNNGKDTTYFNLLRRPKSTVNFFLGAQITRQFYLNAQLNAISSRDDIYFDPVTFQSRNITLKSYLLANLHMEYMFSENRLKVFADVRNIFDKKYSDIYGYNTAGANFYSGFSFSF